MATITSMMVSLRANTGQFNAEMDRAGKVVHMFQQRTQQAHAALATLGKIESSMPALKKGGMFGGIGAEIKESGLGSLAGLTGLAKGGGTLLGINVVAKSLATAAKQAEQLSVAFRRDELTGTQAFEAIASAALKSVPVLNTINEAGENIFDLLDALKNGASFKQQAADATVFEAAITNLNDSLVQQQRLLRDMTGKTPKNTILDQFEDTSRTLKAQRASNVAASGMDPIQRRQIDAAFDAAMAAAVHVRDTQLDRLSAKESGWNPFAGIAEMARTEWGNAARFASNGFAEMVADGDKRIDEATARWKDRIQTKFNTVAHFFKGIEVRVDAFNEAKKAADARREAFISGAAGIFERLQTEARAPVRFASAAAVGSQEEYATRQQAIFGPQVGGRSNQDLAKEAVRLQAEENRKTEEVVRLLREIVREQPGVADLK